jgi:hypothetical protein
MRGETNMRTIQLLIFVLGVLSFLASVFFTGQGMGDTLWRAGVVAMLVDLVCVRIWPMAKSA